jgi:hypothetical protein
VRNSQYVGINDSSTALRTQKASCGEEQCCKLLLLLLCLLGVGALLFPFSSPVPATHVYTALLDESLTAAKHLPKAFPHSWLVSWESCSHC